MNPIASPSAPPLLAQFHVLQADQTLTPAIALSLAEQAAATVIDVFQTAGDYARDEVQLLCGLASHTNDEIARAGTTGIFPLLVERLNDSFDPSACRLYDRVFAQIIDFFRHRPEAAAFDEALNSFGLHNESDLLARKARLASEQSKIQNPKPITQKVIFLSRVTIGADVAIASVVMAKLRRHLPGAEFVLLGSRKLAELYGGDPRIRVRPIAYERGGRMTARLLSWLAVVEAVQAETRSLQPDEFLIVDPDSRLTQLGLLPLLPGDESNYLFFESRSFGPESDEPLGALASQWIGQWLADETAAFPFVALPQSLTALGQQVRAALRTGQDRQRRVITVNFGVGGNDSKRIPGPFEQNLIEQVLADSSLIIDKGASTAERAQVDAFVATLRAQGRKVIELNEQNVAEALRLEDWQAGVVTWDGQIGSFAALIAASDQYIGYDSAGQHIAAALGVPTLTIFVNANSTRFAQRWQPYGKGTIKLLLVDAGDVANESKAGEEILLRVLALHQELAGL